MKKKIWVVTAVIVIVAVGIFAFSGRRDENASGKPVVKIGAALPLSGNFADMGCQAKVALSKSVEEANKNKDNQFYYELLIENAEMNPAKTTAVATKFIEYDKASAIVSLFSMDARVVAPLATKNKTVHINCGYADKNILQSKYNFVNFTPLDSQVRALYDFIKNNKIKRVSLLFENMGGADEILDQLLPVFGQNKIAFDLQRFNPGERDFKQLVRKIKSDDSAGLLVYSFEPEQDIIAKELIQQKVNKKISFVDGSMLSAYLELFDGTYNIGAAQPPAEFKQRLGVKSPNASIAAYVYDIGSVIVSAMEHAAGRDSEVPTGEEISDALLKQKYFTGVVGDYEIAQNGQFYSPVKIYLIKDGEYIKAE